ncbi:MAG: ATP-binding domain-containing protein [Ardenticatenia bacterium]|nr:ATP-binding domain-containing protein [Ardenticatenia bacterium]
MFENQLRWLPSFRNLSEEQQAVINDSFEGSSLIYGPAGSGKTAIALYRAKSLVDQGKSIKVFVFTKVLLQFILAAANDLGIPSHSVQSFYSWVWRQHSNLIGYPNDEGGDDRFSRWTDALIRHFQAYPASKPRYDYIIVDEGQDFRENVAQIIRMLSPNIFIAGDTSQSLYTDLRDMGQLAQHWAPLDRPHTLVRNYRNPKTVAKVAALFLEASPLGADQFLQTVVGRPSEMKPVWYAVGSPNERVDRIAEILSQARGSLATGILFRHREHLSQTAEMLSRRGVRFQVALSGNEYHYSFRDVSIPTLTTIHSAKGIEFDLVVLPDLDADVWDADQDQPNQRRLFFVALTRTKSRLYLISQRDQPSAYLREILDSDPSLLQVAGQAFRPGPSSYADDFDDDGPPPF